MTKIKRKLPEPTAPKVIDPKEVQKLAAIMCTNEEIAAFFEIDEGNLKNHFQYDLTMGRLVGKTSLKRAQWKLAMDGNPTMQIWLGKQYLGQKEPKTLEDQQIEEIRVLLHPNVIST